MRSIILAAGCATRFNGELKGLLAINGETIIARLVRQLKASGVSPICVVVGYRAAEFLQSVDDVCFVYDKDFKSGINSNSLKVALDALGYEDTLMLDADVILSDDLIPKLTNAFQGESISLIDLSRFDEESMKLVIQNDRILKYSKNEGVGAEICSLVSKKQLADIYKDLVTGNYKWWGVGPHTTGFRYVNVNEGSKWMDIDTEDEYYQAKEMFKKI